MAPVYIPSFTRAQNEAIQHVWCGQHLMITRTPPVANASNDTQIDVDDAIASTSSYTSVSAANLASLSLTHSQRESGSMEGVESHHDLETRSAEGAMHRDQADPFDDNDPNIFKIVKFKLDDHGNIGTIKLVLLYYGEHPDAPEHANTYQLYGQTLRSNVSARKMREADDDWTGATDDIFDITDVVTDGYCTIHPSPDGDLVRKVIHGNRCPAAACNNGRLNSVEDFVQMLPFPGHHHRAMRNYRSVCPSCMGLGLAQEHLNLRYDLEAYRFPDIGRIVDFYGRYNIRRLDLGWGMDPYSETEWQLPANDRPNRAMGDDYVAATLQAPRSALRPASAEAINALIHKVYDEVKTEEDQICIICQSVFTDTQLVTILPCGHMFCARGCISVWLRRRDSCPACRASITPGPEQPDAGASGNTIAALPIRGRTRLTMASSANIARSWSLSSDIEQPMMPDILRHPTTTNNRFSVGRLADTVTAGPSQNPRANVEDSDVSRSESTSGDDLVTTSAERLSSYPRLTSGSNGLVQPTRIEPMIGQTRASSPSDSEDEENIGMSGYQVW